jgi:hypothetical protein
LGERGHPAGSFEFGFQESWKKARCFFQAREDFLNEESRKAGKQKSQNHANKIMTQEAGNIRVDDFVTMILSKSSSRPRAFPVGFPRLGKIRADFSKAWKNFREIFQSSEKPGANFPILGNQRAVVSGDSSGIVRRFSRAVPAEQVES